MSITVKLEAFEGPLDLLLHLIEKNKVDIYDIPIAIITDQYMEYVMRMQTEDMDVASEFLVKYGADYVKNYVAEPGFSEHHTGLAIDLYLESVDAWAKIEARLPELGFILRYPLGKENITGYSYEPWHIRYVGKDAAEEIMSEGITLEEYTERQ